MKKASVTMEIDRLVKYLEHEKSLGAKTVTLHGLATLISDHWNSVIMTTEQQI